MSEHKDEQPSDGKSNPGPGQQLRAQRKARSLSVQDVAAELRLDHWMVEALEADDYSRFGAAVFAKGHLRKYAVLLGIDTSDLMLAYYEVQATSEAPPPLIRASSEPAEDVQRDYTWVRYLLIGAAVLVALALLWWGWSAWDARDTARAAAEPARAPGSVRLTESPMLSRPISGTAADSDAADSALPLAVSDNTVDAALDLLAEAPGLSDTLERPSDLADGADTNASAASTAPDALATLQLSAAGAAANGSTNDGPDNGAISSEGTPEAANARVITPEVEAAVSQSSTPEAESDEGEARMSRRRYSEIGAMDVRFRFDEESWVEVRDALDRRLLYGLGRAGTIEQVAGRAPIEVFLGRYAGVQVEVEGLPFEVPLSSLRGNTARFMLAARR